MRWRDRDAGLPTIDNRARDSAKRGRALVRDVRRGQDPAVTIGSKCAVPARLPGRQGPSARIGGGLRHARTKAMPRTRWRLLVATVALSGWQVACATCPTDQPSANAATQGSGGAAPLNPQPEPPGNCVVPEPPGSTT